MERSIYFCASLHPMPWLAEDHCDPRISDRPTITVTRQRAKKELIEAGWLLTGDRRYVPDTPAWICSECAARYWAGPLRVLVFPFAEAGTWAAWRLRDCGTGRMVAVIRGIYGSQTESAYYEVSDSYIAVAEGWRYWDSDFLKTKTCIDYEVPDEVIMMKILSLLNIEIFP